MNVLVISFFFPPFNRVGGRRWAKHVKYMNREGLNTYVLAGDFPNSRSSWDNDILEYKNKITRVKLINRTQPFFKRKLPVNLGEKIKWKISFYSWKLYQPFLKGNYNDVSVNSKDLFLKAACKVIEECKISMIILSVGPFRYSEILIDIKKNFPGLKILLDCRDKWEDSLVGLSKMQQEFELACEKNVLGCVDMVLTVNQNIKQYIENKDKGLKTYVLPHCVDEDFFQISNSGYIKTNEENTVFIYGGELYHSMENELKTFINFFNLFKEANGKEVKANFYLPYEAYNDILKDENIKKHSFLPKENFMVELQKSNFILLFRPDWSSDAFSSKFFEILCIRKPILYFGNSGVVSDFIVSNGLGFHITKDNLKESLTKILNNQTSKLIPNLNYDLAQHTFEAHTKELVKKIQLVISNN